MRRACYGPIWSSGIASQRLARCKEGRKFLKSGAPASLEEANLMLAWCPWRNRLVSLAFHPVPPDVYDNLGCCITRFMLNKRILSACFPSWESQNAGFDYRTSLFPCHRCLGDNIFYARNKWMDPRKLTRSYKCTGSMIPSVSVSSVS